MSFAFRVDAEEWQDLKSDMPTRIIKKISEVREISIVAFPAYDSTDIHARALSTLESAKRALDNANTQSLENDAAELKSINQQLMTLNDDIAALRSAQTKPEEETVTPTTGSATSIVVPSTYNPTINPDFPVVSSLIDAVSHLSLPGGKSFEQPYITDIDTGNYTAEGANAAQAETHFDYAVINQTKVTACAEITEELEKLPAAPYADVVFQNIRTSIRKLLTKEILVGAGGNNQLVGIFSSAATAIDSSTDLAISQITDTTLDEILFRYGGDEEVEDPAVLILNKLDLLAFAKVRTGTKQKFYDIQLHGNGGTISGVPFIINSACKPLMSTGNNAAAAGDYCMAYGSLSSYQLVEFSNLEVKRSDDIKLPQGMTFFRGVAWYGGNVVRKNGFLRICKQSA